MHAFIDSRDLAVETREHPSERRSRLSIEQDRARHELWRDKVLIITCLTALSVVGLVCVVILFVPDWDAERRTWAAATLSAIVSGVVSYSLGKAGKAP